MSECFVCDEDGADTDLGIQIGEMKMAVKTHESCAKELTGG